MGLLLPQEVEVRLLGGVASRYEELGYTLPKRLDGKGRFRVAKDATLRVSVLDLSAKSNIKVKCKCDGCKKEYETQWFVYTDSVKEDGSVYCQSCAAKLYGYELARLSQAKNGTSFEQWCLDNDRQDVLDRWDYELNKYQPSEVGFRSSIKCWFKCPQGLHKSESKRIGGFTPEYMDTFSCDMCNSIGQILINNYGNNAIDKYWSDNNTIKPFEIRHGSKTKIWLKCQNCEHDKKMSFSDFTKYGFSCPKCSDGVSYPNKLAFNMLEQLNINFINEYSPDWIKPKRYDFYFELNNKKYILEMDGGLGHGNKNNLSGQSKEETQAIDDYKDKLAKEHDIEVIRIDCEKSELEYIKFNLINSKLSYILNLSQLDWNKCNEYAYNSLVKICCDLWNNGLTNVTKIVNELKLSKQTVNRYLTQGTKLGWCNYDPKEELKKNFENLSKKVYCFELDRIFNSTMDVERELRIFNSNISACCLGKKTTAGGYRWMYLDDYLELNTKMIG